MKEADGVDAASAADAWRDASPVIGGECITRWADGTIPLRVRGYMSTPDLSHEQLPLELITSVRCMVRVEDRFLFCENKDGSHPWPGGRRNAGESFADTAAREVHEETGWLIDRDSMRQLGWLRLTHTAERPETWVGPYPDFLQVIFTATASERDGGPDAEWLDLDNGYEHTSRLVTLDEALEQTSRDMLAHIFLEKLR